MNSLQNKPRRGAFTLAELLIVITVIVLLFTIAVPSMKALLRSGGLESSATIIGSACSTARAYSSRPTAFVNGNYQGTAMVFTPANEIRFAVHDETTVDGSAGGLLITKTPSKSGYVDISGQAYIRIPDSVGVVGITLGGVGITQLFTPPFAIRFNSQGELIARSANASYNGNVYYNGDSASPDSIATTTSTRTLISGYNPGPYDPSAGGYIGTTLANGKYKLPFETIDTVLGVIFYSKSDLASSGFSISGSNVAGSGNPVACCTGSDAGSWLLQNGRVFFINRVTGAVLK